MTPALADPLRDALLGAGFTYDGVLDVLGPRAHEALLRNETTPADLVTRGGSPVETLVRLFLLQTTVSAAEAERALPGLVDRMTASGMLDRSVAEVAARLDCRPYATDDDELWVVSDLTPGLDGAPVRVGSDHVLGISAASTSLAQLTLRAPVGSALDLGTGCGVQALHLAQHARRVMATDVNQRALGVARFNAALNEVADVVDVRDGSFFAPVAGERYDLIATNPPFVISPATREPLVYRDSGLPGDQVVEHVVRTGPEHLAEDGWLQVLANWVIERDRPWDERLATWLDGDAAGECDALVVQREVLDPAAYVELWLKDEGRHGAPDYAERYDTWLSWLDQQGVEGVGFGWINLHRTGVSRPTRSLLEWPYDVEQPIAPAVASWGTAVHAAATVHLDSHLVAAEGLVQESAGPVGAADPATIVVRQQRGLRRATQVDTVLAAVIGACDGDLSVGRILDAVAHLLDLDAAETRDHQLPRLRELVAEGYLTPA